MYKLHIYWPDWNEGTMGCYEIIGCACYSQHSKLTTPKLYNIAKDPTEVRELDVTAPHHADIVKVMLQALTEHEASVDDVPNQFDLKYALYRPWLQHCCNFPFCNCKDPNNALHPKQSRA